MSKPQLLFIPGLGDRLWLYRLAMPIWRALGYETHVHRFGWNGPASALPERQARLLAYVDALPPGQLSVIGMSAGGTAAVNLLAHRPHIYRVVTVASPLRPKDRPTRPLLAASIREATKFLAEADPATKRKIRSAHGLYDHRVPVSKSRPEGVRTLRLPTVGHGLTIFMAMTVLAKPVRRLLH
jgi:pimeloyl-ACP methyl ester carboxylesterase